MADTNISYKNYTQYSTIIGNAIQDFDDIQGALKAKSVVDTTGAALKVDTTGVPTSDYASLIDNQLFRVEARTKGDVVAPNGVIAYLGTIPLSGAAEFIDGGEGGGRLLQVTATNDKAGYINGSTTLTVGGITAVNQTIAGVLSTDVGSGYTYDDKTKLYTFSAGDGKVFEKLSIKKGSGTISATPSKAEQSGATNTITLAADTDNGNINNKLKTELAEGEEAVDFVKIALNATATGAETITAKITKTFETGYINAEDVEFSGENLSSAGVLTQNFASSTLAIGNQEFYLPKGKITNIAAQEGAKVAFDGADAIIADSGTDLLEEDTFATITGSVGGLKIAGDIGEGWITGGKIPSTNIDVESGAIKIKKGTISGGNTNVHLTATPTKVLTADDGSTPYVISITKDEAGTTDDTTTKPLSVTNGYLPANSITGVSHNVSVEPKDIYLQAAAIKASIGTPKVALDGTASSLITSGAPEAGQEGNYYTIMPKVTATIAEGTDSTDGYYEKSAGAFTGTGLTSAEAGTFYLKKGKVTFTHELSLGTGNASSGITKAEPTEGTLGEDYFTISTSGTLDLTEGYITNNDKTVGDDDIYYLPKAKVKYVTNSTSGNFLEVSSAGYLPTGSIAVTEGDLDLADVKGVLSTTGEGILNSAGNEGAYKISITKSIAEGGAGYISGTEGTLGLDKTYYIDKGSINYKGLIASVNKGAITRDPGKQLFTVNVTAVAGAPTTTITEGYIKEADCTIEDADDFNGSFSLEEATIGVSGTGSIGATASNNVATSTKSKYMITPTFSGGDVKGTITKAGYVDTDSTVTGSVTIADDSKTPLYIKAGTTKTITPTTLAKTLAESEITSDFGQTVSGAYTITVNGKHDFSGNLESGYYGEDEKTISAKTTIAGSFKVAHGAAQVTAASATFNITPGTGLTLVDVPVIAEQEKYFKISANGSNLKLSKTFTEGYVKDADVSAGLTRITGSTDRYIASYKWGEDSTTTAVGSVTDPAGVAAGTYFTPAVTQNFGETADVAVIHTEATYAEHNILVTLGANAIGANAKSDLERLKQRLAGTLAKTGV